MRKNNFHCGTKRTAACIVAAAVLATIAMPSAGSLSGSAANASGGLTGDGSITNADIQVLQNALLGTTKLTAEQAQNADVSEDGVIDGMDLTRLRQMACESVAPQSDTIYIHLSDSGITVEGDTSGVTSIFRKDRDDFRFGYLYR